ncbi:alpha beta-hydrolase [Ceratobasidium sp. AG-I]|nr:alpha beta-hydrolase [Ceratobasidium sp. AG-I]
MRLSIASFAFFCTSAAINSTGPIVKLPYARYQGIHNASTGLDVFLGVKYAKAPVGNLRWRAPKTPSLSNGIIQATSQPAKCFQLDILGGGNDTTPGVPDPSEDCLFLNVFAPPLTQKKLPVLVWIHGGGYYAGYAAQYDPTAMIQASNNSFVAVIIQYRLGMFGFLPGAEVKKNGILNAGLLDVQFALKWTQQNIHLFGGDSSRVTIWGESAGAGAVLMQVVANGGKTKPALFKRAIASSSYVPPTYSYNALQSELKYATFVNSAGCTNSTNTLACLRSLDYSQLARAATLLPFPVVDGTFLTQRPELLMARKQVNGSVYRHNVDEGFILVNQNPNSTVASYLKSQLPTLSEQNITMITNAYGVFTGNNATTEANTHRQQVIIYGEAIFVCPRYQGLFAVLPSYHSEDVGVYFPGIGAYPPAQPFSLSLTQSFMGALVSFIVTGSPNNNPTNATINPHWPTFNPQKPQGMNFNVTDSGIADPKFEVIDAGLLSRCDLWRSLAPYTPQ